MHAFAHLLLLVAMPSVVVNSTWPAFCPHACTCGVRHSSWSQADRRTVDCSSARLVDVPLNISLDVVALVLRSNRIRLERLDSLRILRNLTELDLSDNRLNAVEGFTGELTTLQYLALERNDIDYLSNRTFIKTPNLVYLSIAYNNIETFHSDAFYGLARMRTLDLTANRIYDVHARWFVGLDSLRILLLPSNNLHTLRSGVFQYLTELRHLDLSDNQLSTIEECAFRGPAVLRSLDLHRNYLRTVPTGALQCMDGGVGSLDLSGNHFQQLASGSFNNISAETIKVNDIKDLRFVDRDAFVGLSRLETLHLVDNHKLRYIDRGAFVDTPHMRTLLLHRNNLGTLEQAVVDAMTELEVLGLHGNPLVCDCTLRWLATLRHPSVSINLTEESSIVCRSPASMAGVRLTDDVRMASVGRTCAPRVVALFEPEYNSILGGSLVLDCRAVGVPRPHVDWLLPSPRKSRSGTPGHVTVTNGGTLRIDYVDGRDHGRYACVATNPRGRDERAVYVHVQNMRASVLVTSVTSTSVTVTWRNIHVARDYEIAYGRANGASENATYRSVSIGAFMRAYTASDLKPFTRYRFCIAVRRHSDAGDVTGTGSGDGSVFINCTTVRTRDASYGEFGIHHAKSYVIGGAVGVLALLSTVFCVGAYFANRYNRRRREQEAIYGDHLSRHFLASMDSMSDTTPITFENRAAELYVDCDDDDDEDFDDFDDRENSGSSLGGATSLAT